LVETAAMNGQENTAQRLTEAITEVSERALLLIHEEIELAKAEVGEKVGQLLRGTVVGVAAGIFLVAAVQMALAGLALLAWYLLPVGVNEYFWGFFVVAGVLLLLSLLAGFAAWRAVRRGSPPVPKQAVEEAKRLRETVARSGPQVPSWQGGEGDGAA